MLADATANTAEKLETLKEAEKQVQAQFERGDVSEDQVRALQREIINTENEMAKYKKASKETADAIDQLGKDSEDAEQDVKELGDEAEKTGEDLDDAGDKASAFGEAAKTAGGVAVAGLAAVASIAAAAATALASCSVEVAAYADNILTASTVTGISTEKLQEYTYAAELMDVSVETLTKSQAKQIKSMKSVQDGSKSMVEAYQALGVEALNADGTLRDSETVYWEIIDALGKVENETERDAIAMQILGKSAQELNPLIEAGSEAMAELGAEAHAVGAVLSDEALAAAGAFDDSIQRLNGSTGAAKNALGAVLLPELTMLATEGSALITEFTQNLNASGGGLQGLVDTIGSMSGKLGDKAGEILGDLVTKASDLVPSLISTATSLVTSLVTTIIKAAPSLVKAGGQAILALLEGVTAAIPDILTAVNELIPQLVELLVLGFPLLIDGALKLLLAIVDAVPLLLPTLIKAIPSIVMSIINALMGAIPQLIQGALTLLLAIVDAIPLLIQELVPLIPSIVTAVCGGLLDCIPDLISAAIQLFIALSNGIPEGCNALIKALPQIWNTMWNYLKQLPSKILDIGKSLVEGLWEGIKNKVDWLKNKIKSWVGNVTAFLKSLFGINSPSKVTAWMGEMIDEGFAKGIDDNTKAPLDAMSDLTQGMLDEAEGVDGLAIERKIQHSYSADANTATAHTSSMIGKLDQILQAIERGQIITINGDTLVGATANAMNSALGQRRILAERGAV